MVEEEQTWCKPWERVDFEKVGVQHVDCVGDDGGDVFHGGDVEESHDLPCNLLNSMKSSEELPPATFVLVMTRISVFNPSIFIYWIFHISQVFLFDL